MQIAGNTCTVCDQKIVLSRDGKACPQCKYVVHLACEPQCNCKVCGQPFESYEKPKFDLQNDAIVPPSLRTLSSPGPAFAAFLLVFLAVFVVVMVIYLMTLT